MAYWSKLRKRKWDEIERKQARIDDVLVFDGDQPLQTNSSPETSSNYHRLKYVDFVPTYKFDVNEQKLKLIEYGGIVDKANEWLRTHGHQHRLISCETLYTKFELKFRENFEIQRKRILEVSKWPLQSQEIAGVCIDIFDYSHSKDYYDIFCGKYIVHSLRIWLVEDSDQHRIPQVAYMEYVPQLGDDIQLEGGKKMRGKCWEKMEQIMERINCDLAMHQAPGKLVNVCCFSCFDEEITADQLVNVLRVWFDVTQESESNILIGFADFIPEYVSGGGFIQHPVFETQSQLVKKASDWLECNSEIEFLGCNTMDVKLRSLTSIDTSEMIFPRNTGDFIRILRICYRKVESTTDIDLPPAPPMYLRAKFLVSMNNSNRELRSQLNEFMTGSQWHETAPMAHRWRPLFAETMPHFIAGRGRKPEEREAVLEQSFHAISISSVAMNRKLLTGIHVYYDVGFYEHQQQQLQAQQDVKPEKEASAKSNRCVLL